MKCGQWHLSSQHPTTWSFGNEFFFDILEKMIVFLNETSFSAGKWTKMHLNMNKITHFCIDSDNYREKLDSCNVSLENVIVKEKDSMVIGTVKVKNLCFHKEVIVRSTWDNWKTQQDTICTYTPVNLPITRTMSVDWNSIWSSKLDLFHLCKNHQIYLLHFRYCRSVVTVMLAAHTFSSTPFHSN